MNSIRRDLGAEDIDTIEDWRGPIALVDIEVDDPEPIVDVASRYRRGRLRLRLDGRLVGVVDEIPLVDGRLPAEQIRAAVTSARPPGGWPVGAPPLAGLPSASVAVCTRGRGSQVLATVAAFENLRYERPVEILVVENVPDDDSLRRELTARPQRPDRPVHYLAEPLPGASRARNRAIAAATGDVIAFTDDDATPEPQWLEAIIAGFQADVRVGAVSGLTIAAEIETQAQELWELFDAFNRGRGLERLMFRPTDPGTQRLYPMPLRAAGVNFAFRRDLIASLGGFAPGLGAGYQTCGGEDLAVVAEVLMSGHYIAYEPNAVVRHTHRRELPDLMKVLAGYGTGTAAYLTWCLHRHPLAALGMIKMVPAVGRYFVTGGKSHESPDHRPVPPRLSAELRSGMLEGPRAYVREMRRERRLLLSAAAGH